ncbi:hemerythrin domain-containing protein [Nonomuraea terrae]|uniref:hemerythrin domain-containing protein n=1 Tax=Nonomuraea terrae TaxID=2530383 RepID=UPI0037BB079B
MTHERPADARDMFAVHTMFRREYSMMPGLVRAVTAGDRPRLTVVADHIALMNQVLHGHHMAEDTHIWPLLLERVDAELTAIVSVMEDQHERIHQGYVRLDTALASWRKSASAHDRDAVAEVLDALLPLLDEHLALEEARVVPLIERHLTAEEYARVAEEGAAHTPPDAFAVVFGMVMYEGDPEVIAGIMARMPADVRPTIRDVATAAYATYAQRLYGIAMPPRVLA